MNREDQTFNKLSDQRNLYLCSQTTHNGYDTYDSIIVAAWTEKEARNIKPTEYTDTSHTWATPDQIDVQLIGLAIPGLAGVVITSFNAG